MVLRGNFYTGPSKFYPGQARVGPGVATPLLLRLRILTPTIFSIVDAESITTVTIIDDDGIVH